MVLAGAVRGSLSQLEYGNRGWLIVANIQNDTAVHMTKAAIRTTIARRTRMGWLLRRNWYVADAPRDVGMNPASHFLDT